MATVPLVFDPAGYFIFLPVKLTLVDVLVPLGIAGLILERRWMGRTVPSLAWIAFLAVLVIAAALGVGGITSWIGYPGRYLGVIGWAVFAGAFWLGSSLPEADRPRVVRAATAASIVVSTYALLQYAGVDLIQWEPNIDVSRTRSTLGNAAFLGAYLCIVIPLAARMALERSEPERVRIIHGVAALLGLGALLTTETRGALLGVLIAVLALAAFEYRQLRGSPGRALAAGGVVLVALVFLVTISPFASRIRSIVDPTTGTARGRLVQWGDTIDLAAERPFLGWGPDTYAFVFPRFIDAEFERTVGRDVIPDRAHNVLLDVAAASGLLGVVGFLAVLGTIAWSVAKSGRRDPMTIGLASACVAYLVQLQFGFPLADVDVLFWLFAGMLVAMASRPLAVARIWSGIPFVVAVALGVWGASDVAADRTLRRALQAEADAEFERALTLGDQAADVAPGRLQYVQADARLHRRIAEVTGRVEDFAVGLQLLDDGLDIAPRDLELALDRADLLLSWGESAADEGLIARAVTQYENVLTADPASSRAHLKVGVAYVELGRADDAEDAWLTAASLAPTSPAPLVNLGILYERQGRTAEALAVLERAMELDPSSQVARAALARLEAE